MPYSEDQAFGRAMLAAGWAKAYHPGAGRAARARLPARRTSCAATSTSTAACARRSGTSSGSALRSTLRDVRALVAARPALDARAGHGAARAQARWTGALGRCTTAGARCSRRSARGPTAAGAGAAGDLARGPRRRRRAARRGAGPARSQRTAARARPDAGYDAIARVAATARRRCSSRCRAWRTRERAARRGRDPAVPARHGGHNDDLPACSRGSSERGHTVLASGCTTRIG